MTRLFVRLAGLICLIWLGLYAGIVFIGTRQAATGSGELSQYGFDACQLPCWSGIIPGETTSGFIIPLLEKNIPAFMDARFPEGGVVIFRLENDMGGNVRFGSTVNQIYLVNLEVATAYLIEELAQPDCVSMQGDNVLLMWNRGQNVIITVFIGSPVDILATGSQSIGLMVFEGGNDFCRLYTRWSGFAPSWYYRRAGETP